MAEIRINTTGGVKLYDADDSHYAQILAGTITSNVDALTLGSSSATFSIPVTVGVDDTGHDVKFFGASAGAYMEWDESADQLRIMGASADATTSTGKLLLATSLTDINANDVIGKIEFQAPHEGGGTDAITVAAGIQAIAQGTFSASVNATDLIFYTGHSEAATEKFRFTSQGEIGIGGTNYGTDGQVLTSGGAGAAPAWEDASGAVTALNNATANELVTVGSTTTELDAESGLTYTDGALVIGGTTPSLTIGDAGAEDTKIVFDGNAQDFHIGLDDSADDLVIGLGSSLGTTTHMAFDEAGTVTMPLQPAFCVTCSNDVNAEIAGETYKINFATERFDQNADFNTTTFTFTAPVTGKYQFNCLVRGDDVWETAVDYYSLQLVTSNNTYRIIIFDPNNYDQDLFYHSITGSILADMDASDTVYLQLSQASGGTDNLCVVGDGTWWSGHLVC